MKYPATAYAKAFAAVAAKPGIDQERVVKNFVALVVKNGDAKDIQKIVKEAGRILREAEGIRKFTFESARSLGDAFRKSLAALAGPKDVIEEKIDPSLVAGVRVTIDDERQFDGSLAKKLQKLFPA